MRNFSRLLAASTTLLLAACYNSDTPLLTAAEADYPFAQRIEYTRTDVAGVQTQGTLRRDGDHYVLDQPGQDPETTLLFQQLEGEYYLVQETDTALGTANYDAVRITPDTVYLLGMRCSEIFDADAVIAGDFYAEDADFGLSCEAFDLEPIRAALKERMSSVLPQESYLILGTFP